MSGDPETIEIDLERDLIDGAVRKVVQFFRVALPAIVSTFARDPGRANAVLGAQFAATNLTPLAEAPVQDLPVHTPRGGGYGLYFDPREGDLGLAICCDMPVRPLYETGEVVAPQRPVGHDYASAVFLPGGRVSSSQSPTPPPNPTGTIALMADDGSAAVTLRGAGLTDPAELGSMTLATAGPTASLLLGGDAAVLGVGRLTDPVDRNALLTTWMSQVTAVCNAISPGSVTPFVTPTIGTISGASTKVVSE